MQSTRFPVPPILPPPSSQAFAGSHRAGLAAAIRRSDGVIPRIVQHAQGLDVIAGDLCESVGALARSGLARAIKCGSFESRTIFQSVLIGLRERCLSRWPV